MRFRSSWATLLVLVQPTGCAGEERRGLTPHTSHVVGTGVGEGNPGKVRTHPEGTVFATASVMGRPFGIALSHTGIVYCTLLDAASLARTTLASHPLTFIGTGSIPTDVAFSPAGTWAYVTNQQARTIGVVDVRRDRQVATIDVEGDPYRVVVGPEGQAVYATTNLGNLVQIDAETRTVSWTMQLGGSLNGLAITPDGSRIYVGDVSGKLYEVDPSGEILRSLTVPGHPQGLALPSTRHELYVAGEAGYLIVVDLESWVEVTRVRLDAGGFGIAVSPDQAQIWITAPRAGKVFVLDRLSRTIMKTIVVGGIPRRMAFDQFGATAVVADEAGAIRFLR